jgi:argininosuccinate lyase
VQQYGAIAILLTMQFGHQLNRASLVAVHDAGLIDEQTARRIANALTKIEEELSGRYVSIVLFVRDYPTLEQRLVELAGANASLLHLGIGSLPKVGLRNLS